MRVILVILLFLSTTVYSQSFDHVDQTRSFLGFTFGCSPESIKGSLQLDLVISYGVKYYKYKGPLLKQLYGKKPSQVTLGFRDDQLEYLDVYFNKLDKGEFSLLLSHLQTDYGMSTPFNTAEQGVVGAEEWLGENLVMQFYLYDNTAIDHDDRDQTVLTLGLVRE
ncbi:hypothetical protein C900_03487 [Fulvivirga imtechensis AK7]|uniref:Uncharacterized protein n=1 Tax=Fulvivirga imtechensis AK7 TaxID=1237149 RepID=L8JTA0_9BACT|nr:hypothetical protein [Fulvivirga imtechensis]ELR70714.1 hypothetical protein C900_03487 [Fulvivirga imtechensis AK7]